MTTNVSAGQVRLTEQVAEEIRALLARRRISGRELARRIGASYSWVNFRLTGAQPLTLDDLDRIAAVLEVDYRDLLPQREGRLITVGGAPRTTTRGDLTTAHSPLAKQPGTFSRRGRLAPAQKGRTGRIRANLIAA